MPSAVSAIDLLEMAESLGLVTAAETAELRAQWSGQATLASDAAAEQLVERQLLTDYQSHQLLAGNGQSLVISGRYQLVKLLGEGGMGQVLLATDVQLQRTVAVKVLPAQLVNDAGAIARFEREAKALARLSHPNIVQAYDAGSDGAQHYLVMEQIDGLNLSHLVKQQGAMGSIAAAGYAYQTALGLRHAHQKGLIHRDLKPSNLLITRDHQVKILDLGLARFLQDQIAEETLTLDGTALGTPDYMAPEQFGAARHADERSDIYALGCTLYHMLTGRVPFPGSSLTEKKKAHEQVDAEPVESLVSGIPAGLAQAIRKMMAKRPADRFQTADHCAEALLPYVDASSPSLPDLAATSSWDGSQLRIVTRQAKRRRVIRRTGLGMTIVLAGVAMGLGLAQLRDGLSPPAVAKPSQSEGMTAGTSGPGDEPSARPPSPADDPWVLTVSQKAAGGGQFRSINAALEQARPGMTVRVLDDAVYAERLLVTSPSRHRGLSLLADHGATLQNDVPNTLTIMVTDVPDVTIQGFRMRLGSTRQSCIGLRGNCAGTRIYSVQFEATPGQGCNGIEAYHLNDTADDIDPVVVSDSSFGNMFYGVVVIGVDSNGMEPRLCRGLVVRDNTFVDAQYGVVAYGQLARLHLVGNRFFRSFYSAVQFQDLAEGTHNVLVANNTFVENRGSVRLWDDAVAEADIQVRGNLVVDPLVTDFLFLDSGGTEQEIHGPGDVEALQRQWEFGENWREISPPSGTDVISQSWIPPSATSVCREQLDSISRDPSSPDYLRPVADSELATGGAGKTEPSLPGYVGALPPEGTEPWDWSRTWDVPPGEGQLLTVSQNSEDGGRYRTISEALRAAEPWATIRVLDDATYAEPLVIEDAAVHQGISLEAPRHATLQLDQSHPTILIVRDVAHVRVSGFNMLADSDGEPTPLVRVSGNVAGLRLERLSLFDDGGLNMGISLSQIRASRRQPVVVRACSFRLSNTAIVVSGMAVLPVDADGAERLPDGALVIDNRIHEALIGVLIRGALNDCLVAGNTVGRCPQAGIQVEELWDARHVWIANNSCFDSGSLFRVWCNESEPEVRGEPLDILANVFLDPVHMDLSAIVVSQTGESAGRGVGSISLGRDLANYWRFRGNWRQMAGTLPQFAIPQSDQDRSLVSAEFVSRDAADPDFLRPTGDSLETFGRGGLGGDLPTYAGAIPPAGTRPWNWETTWRIRTGRE